MFFFTSRFSRALSLVLVLICSLRPSVLIDTLITTQDQNNYSLRSFDYYKRVLTQLGSRGLLKSINESRALVALITFGIEKPSVFIPIDQVFYDLVTQSWLSVTELTEESSVLWSKDGSTHTIKSITYLDAAQSYSFELQKNHIFFLGELMLMASTRDISWHKKNNFRVHFLSEAERQMIPSVQSNSLNATLAQ